MGVGSCAQFAAGGRGVLKEDRPQWRCCGTWDCGCLCVRDDGVDVAKKTDCAGRGRFARCDKEMWSISLRLCWEGVSFHTVLGASEAKKLREKKSLGAVRLVGGCWGLFVAEEGSVCPLSRELFESMKHLGPL